MQKKAKDESKQNFFSFDLNENTLISFVLNDEGGCETAFGTITGYKKDFEFGLLHENSFDQDVLIIAAHHMIDCPHFIQPDKMIEYRLRNINDRRDLEARKFVLFDIEAQIFGYKQEMQVR